MIPTIDPAFGAKVERDGDCWRWTGYIAPNGYGNYRGRAAHRVAYELLVGPVPEGLVLDHVCRNRACVNPDHLDAVTQRENVYRGRLGHIPLYCKRGHYRTAASLYRSSSGGLGCRPCQAIHSARWRNKHRRTAARLRPNSQTPPGRSARTLAGGVQTGETVHGTPRPNQPRA